ncbi:8223_t:CDS:2, partial [Paraglomus occultum]
MKDVGYLRFYWTAIITDRRKIFVKNSYDIQSLDLLQVAGESSTTELKSLYSSKRKIETVYDKSDEVNKSEQYATVIKEIIRLQENDNAAAHTNPLWWGVLDLQAEKKSPCVDVPRAQEFLSQEKVV